MNTEDIIKEVKKLIKTIIPPTIEITNIELEGPDIAIYTKNIEEFANNNDIVRQLAQGLRRWRSSTGSPAPDFAPRELAATPSRAAPEHRRSAGCSLPPEPSGAASCP